MSSNPDRTKRPLLTGVLNELQLLTLVTRAELGGTGLVGGSSEDGVNNTDIEWLLLVEDSMILGGSFKEEVIHDKLTDDSDRWTRCYKQGDATENLAVYRQTNGGPSTVAVSDETLLVSWNNNGALQTIIAASQQSHDRLVDSKADRDWLFESAGSGDIVVGTNDVQSTSGDDRLSLPHHQFSGVGSWAEMITTVTVHSDQTEATVAGLLTEWNDNPESTMDSVIGSTADQRTIAVDEESGRVHATVRWEHPDPQPT